MCDAHRGTSSMRNAIEIRRSVVKSRRRKTSARYHGCPIKRVTFGNMTALRHSTCSFAENLKLVWQVNRNTLAIGVTSDTCSACSQPASLHNQPVSSANSAGSANQENAWRRFFMIHRYDMCQLAMVGDLTWQTPSWKQEIPTHCWFPITLNA